MQVRNAREGGRRRTGLPDMNKVHVLFREPPSVTISSIVILFSSAEIYSSLASEVIFETAGQLFKYFQRSYITLDLYGLVQNNIQYFKRTINDRKSGRIYPVLFDMVNNWSNFRLSGYVGAI